MNNKKEIIEIQEKLLCGFQPDELTKVYPQNLVFLAIENLNINNIKNGK
ncbi:MAG: hypothetical protein KJ566_00875 [Nanoarchaeota archaeon]|nr:hypothetical protein [Nanoarchaeota archaeon]